MLFVSEKRYTKLLNELVKSQSTVSELTKSNMELINSLHDKNVECDNLIDDNQDLRNINEFYIKKYNDAKNMIRLLNNRLGEGTEIPENCPNCNNVLIYNENLHIATCPECKITIK